jgi:exoribonuclease R
MYASPNAVALLDAGLAAVRAANGLASSFPHEVQSEATAVADRPVDRSGRVDLTGVAFATLDPASSTDLDQAFALAMDGDAFVLRYAIADVGAFVARGSELETEAWERASTIYLPDAKIAQYPATLSEGAASLLPNVDRPAIVMTVVLGPDLAPTLRSIERAVVRSQAKLAYETVTPEQAHPLLAAFAARMDESDQARGAERVQRPEQEIVHDPEAPGQLRLTFRAMTASEEANSAMSLAANLALGSMFVSRGLGLFRDLDDPSKRDVAMLRRTAKALGVAWSDGEPLRDLLRRLRPDVPADASFSIAVRRAGGGARYRFYRADASGEMRSEAKTGTPDGPWHAAMGAPYVHATAPLRRLADRYVLDLAVALFAGGPSADFAEPLTRLPPVMDAIGMRASKIDRACIDLVEAVVMVGREGEVFDGAVVESDPEHAVVHLINEGIRVRLALPGCSPGDAIRLRLDAADTTKGTVTFTQVDQSASTPPRRVP